MLREELTGAYRMVSVFCVEVNRESPAADRERLCRPDVGQEFIPSLRRRVTWGGEPITHQLKLSRSVTAGVEFSGRTSVLEGISCSSLKRPR